MRRDSSKASYFTVKTKKYVIEFIRKLHSEFQSPVLCELPIVDCSAVKTISVSTWVL